MKNTEKRLEINEKVFHIGFQNMNINQLQKAIDANIAACKFPIIKHTITGGMVSFVREETDKEFEARLERLRKIEEKKAENRLKAEANRRLKEKITSDPRYKQFLELKKEFGKYV